MTDQYPIHKEFGGREKPWSKFCRKLYVMLVIFISKLLKILKKMRGDIIVWHQYDNVEIHLFKCYMCDSVIA